MADYLQEVPLFDVDGTQISPITSADTVYVGSNATKISDILSHHTSVDDAASVLSKDILNVDLQNKYGVLNSDAYIYITDSTWSNRPTTSSGTFLYFREVLWMDASHVIVRLTELYPTNGNVWLNSYDVNKWTGWQRLVKESDKPTFSKYKVLVDGAVSSYSYTADVDCYITFALRNSDGSNKGSILFYFNGRQFEHVLHYTSGASPAHYHSIFVPKGCTISFDETCLVDMYVRTIWVQK